VDAAFIRPKGGFGDVLCISVAVRLFKEAHPDIKIDFFCPSPYIQAICGHPDIRTLYECDYVQFNTKQGPPSRWWRKLAWRDYDLCFEMLGPEMKVEWAQAPNIRMHRIEMWCEAVGVDYDGITQPVYEITPIERKVANWQWDELGLPTPGGMVPLVGLQTGSANIEKDWPLEHWKVLQELLAKEGVHCCLFGKNKKLMWENDHTTAFRKQSFRESAALAAKMDLIISPDSAYHHLAPALGVPSIAIFGPTDAWLDPDGSTPWGPEFVHPVYPDCLVVSTSAERGCQCWFEKTTTCSWGEHLRGRREMGVRRSPAPCMREIAPEDLFVYATAKMQMPQRNHGAETFAASV